MIKETITYKDFNGHERTEDFYFNFTEQELAEMNWSTAGGLDQLYQDIVQAEDGEQVVKVFKKLIMDSYGKKTPDGRGFVKTEEILLDFVSTNAFSDLFMRLASDDKEAARFFNGVLPDSLKDNKLSAVGK